MVRAPENPEKGGSPLVPVKVFDGPPEIEMSALVAMFRRAAKNGPCPSEDILKEIEFLQYYSWITPMTDFVKSPLEPAEVQEARDAIAVLIRTLPKLINRKVENAGLISATSNRTDELRSLEALNSHLGAAIAALGVKPKKKTRSAPWYAAAETIACDAMRAWAQAGRRDFGTNPTSPVVKFTQEFLALGGIRQEANTIAIALQRGRMRLEYE